MSNEIVAQYEQTQALAEANKLNYIVTIPTNGRQIELKRNVDFQKIDKFKQPTLTKAGCLRIAKEGYGLCVEPIIEHAIETLDPFPYFFSRAACTSADTAFSLMKGPPGTACITKNVIVITIQIVSNASPILLRMYLNINTPLYQSANFSSQIRSRGEE